MPSDETPLLALDASRIPQGKLPSQQEKLRKNLGVELVDSISKLTDNLGQVLSDFIRFVVTIIMGIMLKCYKK